MSDATPMVSIIVPVRNAERTLQTTFEYLLNVEYPRDRMEIVIADGGSTDRTVAVIQEWKAKHSFITFVQVPNCPSPGHARNAALEVVKGQYVLFTDGDCAPNKDWVTLMLQPFAKDPKIGGVGGEIQTLRCDPNSLVESYCEQVGFLSVRGRYGKVSAEGFMPQLTDLSPSEVSAHNAPFFATANACFSMEAIRAVGGKFWPEPTGEDVEFSIRVQKAGFRLYYMPSAVVKHMHRLTADAFDRVWIGYGKGHPVLVQSLAADMFEIVWQFLPGSPSLKIPSKVKGLVYLGPFHLMHVFAFLTFLLLAAGLGNRLPAVWALWCICAGLTGYFAYRFFSPLRKIQPASAFWTWCKIKYGNNWSFMKGALLNFKRTKVLYIEPSF